MSRIGCILTRGVVTAAAGAEPPAEWAFSPLTDPTPPNAPLGSPALSPADHFLLGRLSADRLGYRPWADRRTMIRRATFDLTGFPLTRGDRCLPGRRPARGLRGRQRPAAGFPAFAERVALCRLDLVLYAEARGFKWDEPRPLACGYRDYVIDSFNADKPYDQCVHEQGCRRLSLTPATGGGGGGLTNVEVGGWTK